MKNIKNWIKNRKKRKAKKRALRTENKIRVELKELNEFYMVNDVSKWIDFREEFYGDPPLTLEDILGEIDER